MTLEPYHWGCPGVSPGLLPRYTHGVDVEVERWVSAEQGMESADIHSSYAQLSGGCVSIRLECMRDHWKEGKETCKHSRTVEP